jgi:hypothetical protein
MQTRVKMVCGRQKKYCHGGINGSLLQGGFFNSGKNSVGITISNKGF